MAGHKWSPGRNDLEAARMRRGTSETNHAPAHPATASSGSNNASSNIRSSRNKGHARSVGREKKRCLFYVLVGALLLFQGVIFPWIISSKSSSDPTASSSGTLRGRPLLNRPADGTFNEYPIYLHKNVPFHSSVHCVGETHNPATAWLYRSCEFENLCLDTKSNEFFVVESQLERELQSKRVPQTYVSTELSSHNTSLSNLTVALGGINPRWEGNGFNLGIEKVQWFPQRVQEAPSQYYMLDERVVLVPFHSFAAHNVGHMLWDDFLPIFTLLQIFGWSHLMGGGGSGDSLADPHQLMLLRVDTLPLLYGTCEMRRSKGKKCSEHFEKFLPLLGVDPKTFTSVKTIKFNPKETNTEANGSTWVCARHAMAGIGMLTDHGLKDHGWLMPKETHSVQNTAKGALLYQFRNALLHNLNLPIVPPRDNPVRIVLSAHSSSDPPRDANFVSQQTALAKSFPDILVQTVELSKMGLREQVELVSQTRIFVSTCGGGSMTATFLPKGATLILYYDEDGGYDFKQDFNLTGDPAMLDWDLFNNMAHLRVHWLPVGTMNTKAGYVTLAYLIRHELNAISNGI